MTCEVAVMNKYGVALAADTAATFGRGQKIYHAAEKIFQLSQFPPVGLMISGSAEVMDMPWETVIKTYSRQASGRRFQRLEQYAEDFLRWVEEATVLFPADLQRDWFRDTVRRYWKDEFLEPLARVRGPESATTARPVAPFLDRIVTRQIARLRRLPALPGGEELGACVTEEYGQDLNDVQAELFRAFRLPAAFIEKFRLAVRLLHSHAWFHPSDQTGLVFAGMGEDEPFPLLREFQVGQVVAGRLRHLGVGEGTITRQVSAIVAPFGLTEMVDIFYRGIDPGLEQRLYHIIRRAVGGAGLRATQAKDVVARIERQFSEEILGRYQSPLISAVEALPRQGLGTMAEALVSLTALKLRMSVEMAETVGGSIDVAILSRGDGFTWVKRTSAGRDGGAMVIP